MPYIIRKIPTIQTMISGRFTKGRTRKPATMQTIPTTNLFENIPILVSQSELSGD
jgi:hypothetical protein